MAIFRKNRKEKDGAVSVETDPAVSLPLDSTAAEETPRASSGRSASQLALERESSASPKPQKTKKHSHSLSALNFPSMANLLNNDMPLKNHRSQTFDVGSPAHKEPEAMGEREIHDIISAKFDSIITLIDGGRFQGHEANFHLGDSDSTSEQKETKVSRVKLKGEHVHRPCHWSSRPEIVSPRSIYIVIQGCHEIFLLLNCTC